MSFKPFESKLSPFPWRNTGQTMSIGVKNKFQGRSHHFRSKPSPPSHTISTGVKNEFQVISGQNHVHGGIRVKPR